MARKQEQAIRPCGTRVKVYNEGLCVYLHDAGNADKLRELIARKGNAEEPFFNNLLQSGVEERVRKDALALSYQLDQDDEVCVEVIVGPPLTVQELSVARWYPPQHGRINLATGQLRIDSPNTMPLDPDEKIDTGGIVTVTPGDYLLTLYRVDWSACEREKVKFSGIGEAIVLTPIAEVKSVPACVTNLEFPAHHDKREWVSNYTISSRQFACQLCFISYWERMRLNLDPDAVKQLGLRCGSTLRVKAARMTFDLVYIDDWKPEDFLNRFGQDSFDNNFADRKEAGIVGWQNYADQQILICYRCKSTKAAPVKYHDVWIPAAGEVLTEEHPPPATHDVSPPVVSANTITAAVIDATPERLIINVSESQLATFGDIFKLVIDGDTCTVGRLSADQTPIMMCLTGPPPDMVTRWNPSRLRLFVRDGVDCSELERFELRTIPRDEREPVVGFFVPPSRDSLSAFLHIRPMYVDNTRKGFDFLESPAIGTTVQLRAM